ncbi:MAG: nucleotide exchange factor GrpE [Candidatus Dormibacteria bacterium]
MSDETAGVPRATEEGDPVPAADDAAAETVERDLRDALMEVDNRYVRLAADFENYKRRKAQELLDSRRYASEDAARTMLPVLDNLRRAVEHAPEGGAEDFFVNGLHLVVREFEAALERLGVEQVRAVGEQFDPAIHEAIGGEESDDVEHDTVVAELLPGYRLHDRLLRPAVVRVAHPRRSEPPA